VRGGLLLHAEREREKERERERARKIKKVSSVVETNRETEDEVLQSSYRSNNDAKEEERNNHCRQRERDRSEASQTSGGKCEALHLWVWVTGDSGYQKSSTQPFHRPHRIIQLLCESITHLSPLRIRGMVFLPPKPLFLSVYFFGTEDPKFEHAKVYFRWHWT